MFIATANVYMSAEWVYSLKEKRMVVKSIIEKTRHRFNVSIAEVDKQDIHRSIVLGLACVSSSKEHATSMLQNVLSFIERNTDAVVDDVFTEVL